MIQEWIQQPLTILDVGCGTGEITAELARLGYPIVGSDIDRPTIEQARKRHRGVAFVSLSARQIDTTFDVVLCSEVLEHLQRPDYLLGQIHRILPRFGAAIITVPNGRGPYELLTALASCIRKPKSVRCPHVQWFRLKEIRQLFADAGFKIVAERGRTFLCGPYVDLLPLPQWWYRFNGWLADRLPLQLSSGWIFLLTK